MRHQQVRIHRNQGDRREVVARVVRQLVVDADIQGEGRREKYERIAVRCPLCTEIVADGAARAGPRVVDDRVPPCLGELLADNARENVGESSRGVIEDPANRLFWGTPGRGGGGGGG